MNDPNIISETKRFLDENYEMKDLGLASMILCIKLKKTIEGITQPQPPHVKTKVFNKHHTFDCKPVSTPLNPNDKLIKNGEESVSPLKYPQLSPV